MGRLLKSLKKTCLARAASGCVKSSCLGVITIAAEGVAVGEGVGESSGGIVAGGSERAEFRELKELRLGLSVCAYAVCPNVKKIKRMPKITSGFFISLNIAD